MENVFKPFGSLTELKLLRDKSGKIIGSGFVSFDDENSVIQALESLHNKIIFGRILHLSKCKKRYQNGN